jgi:hypothetical protein
MNALHVVAWRDVFRVVDDRGAVAAVCETLDEAEAYIAGQAAARQPKGE